ncbi:MAG: hypothetical protein KJO08_10660, partial [Gammaproteobacteria bacterium]|nr:hypothetical protein [Gammaproteobacteria bacterium]NNJ84469.1 hypothetical protein [Gammaproteobacteria bacterium]
MINTSKDLFGLLTSPSRWPGWQRHWSIKAAYITVILVLVLTLVGNDLYAAFFRLYTGDKTAAIVFDTSVALSEAEFETLATRMETKAMAGELDTLLDKMKDPSVKRERERLRTKQKS